MIAAIEAKYTGEVTAAEAVETLNKIKAGHYALPQMRGALQGAAWLANATAAEVKEVLDWYAPILERELKALDDANRFRPDYAPKGQLTKNQCDAQLVAQQTTRIVRMLQRAHSNRVAKEQAK